jgi:tetratricopeptide (TPR) repeat protein
LAYGLAVGDLQEVGPVTTGEAGGTVQCAPRTPNTVLRGIRESERHESQSEFAEAMAQVARDVGVEAYPDGQYVQRLESGHIRWPHRTYRNILEKLCGRSARELGFAPSARSADNSGEISSRVNVQLREAVWESGMELAEFARKIGVDPKTAGRWITRGRIPQPFRRWKASLILGVDESELWPGATPLREIPARGRKPSKAQLAVRKEEAIDTLESALPFDPVRIADRVSELANWAEATNIGGGTLSYLDSATFELAHDCLTVPPFQTGERADTLIDRISSMLRTGHQRLDQTRDLYIIAGKLCAILSWISSDLGQLAAADAHVRNGWTLAEQADHNGLRAALLSARSKSEFLRRRYGDAAVLARRGYEFRPPGTISVLLACQEADALQAEGRIEEAKEALNRSEGLQDTTSGDDEFGGIFGCGIARQANYSISTYLKAGSVDQALRHVERAELAWRSGEEWAYGTWAQVQIGAAIAHLLNGEIEAAVNVMQQVLNQPEEQRLATLATRMRRDVTPLLANPATGGSKSAILLREGIENYDKSPIRPLPAGGEL